MKFEILEDKIQAESPTIIDAGAYKGSSTEALLESFPEATVHAIEPHPEHLEVLRQKFQDNSNVVIHPLAIGPEKGETEFNILQKSALVNH